jgi:hypothetical protein
LSDLRCPEPSCMRGARRPPLDGSRRRTLRTLGCADAQAGPRSDVGHRLLPAV